MKDEYGYELKVLKIDQIPDSDIAYCIRRILRDGLKLSKKMLNSALETFAHTRIKEEDEEED